MKILLSGKTGQLGAELVRSLAALGEVFAVDRTELDVAHPEQIASVLRQRRPDVVVNAAAYTAVERAEREPHMAAAVNAVAPGVMADESRRIGALFLHYSTDYVFDGAKTSPYVEEDAPRPLNVYGRTKLAGERAVESAGGRCIVLRTSWVYSSRRRNFLLAILEKASRGEAITVVADQVGAPTWSSMLAEASARIIAGTLSGRAPDAGLFHLAASGSTTWYGFAQAILDGAGLPARLTPIQTEDYGGVPRPKNSLLSSERAAAAFGIRLPDWTAGLEACLKELRASPQTSFQPWAR